MKSDASRRCVRSSAPGLSGDGQPLQMPVEEGASLWRDQRAELDRGLALGLIDADDFESASSALTQAAKSDLVNAAPTA